MGTLGVFYYSYLKSSMERFIAKVSDVIVSVYAFKIQYGEIYSIITADFSSEQYDLKSSMERFIERFLLCYPLECLDLKSSMERFIGRKRAQIRRRSKYLKSSMERFIGTKHSSNQVRKLI